MKPLSQREERNDETVNVQTTRFYMSLVSPGDPEKRLFKYYVVEPTNTSAGSQTSDDFTLVSNHGGHSGPLAGSWV